jgi:hypothetical protein
VAQADRQYIEPLSVPGTYFCRCIFAGHPSGYAWWMILRGPYAASPDQWGLIKTPDHGYRRGEEREVLIPEAAG